MHIAADTPSATGSISGALTRRSLTAGAALAGVAGAVLYSLSPLTACLLAVAAAVIGWAAHDLPSAERRRVIGILAASVALRVMTIGLIAWRNDPWRHAFSTIFPDALYNIKMSLWFRNAYFDIPLYARDYLDIYGSNYAQTGYHKWLATVQVLFGPAPYGVHVLNVVLYLTGVVALFRIARAGYGPMAGLIGLVATLFMPTLFVWSIIPLKESAYFFFMAVAISAVVALRRPRSRVGAAAALTVAAMAVAGINSLRAGGLAIALGGLAIGLGATLAVRSRGVLTALLVVAPFVTAWTVTRPSVHDAMLEGMRASVGRHIGHVGTPGTSYKLVALDFYRDDRLHTSVTFDEGVQFLARAVVAFVLVPKPWEVVGHPLFYMAPQQIAWYALFGFALVGMVAGLSRDRLFTCLLAGNVIAGMIVIAPNSGNVGTLIRHRDMVVPFVLWLSSIGLLATLQRAASVLPATRPGVR